MPETTARRTRATKPVAPGNGQPNPATMTEFKHWSGTTVYGGKVRNEEHLVSLDDLEAFGRVGGVLGVYHKMYKSDPECQMVVQTTVLPIVGATATMRIAKGGDEAYRLAAEQWFFEWFPFERRLGWIVRSFMQYGHTLADKKYANKNGIWYLADLGHIQARSVDKFVGQGDRLAAVIQQAAQGDEATQRDRTPITIEGERLLYWVRDRDGNNWRGNAVLRPCYGPWSNKHQTWTMIRISNERASIGVPTAHTARSMSSDEEQHLVDQLRGFASHEQSYMILDAQLVPPENLVVHYAGKGDNASLREDAAYFGHQILQAGWIGFQVLGTMPSGSRAVATVQQEMFELALKGAAAEIAAAFNPEIKFLCDLNIGTPPDGKYPYISFENPKAPDLQSLAALLNAGAVISDDVLEDEVRQALGMPPADRKTRVKTPVEIEEKKPKAETEAEELHGHASGGYQLQAAIWKRPLRPAEQLYDLRAINNRFDQGASDVQRVLATWKDEWLRNNKDELYNIARQNTVGVQDVLALIHDQDRADLTATIDNILQDARAFGRHELEAVARRKRRRSMAAGEQPAFELKKSGTQSYVPHRPALKRIAKDENTTDGAAALDKYLEQNAAELADTAINEVALSTTGEVKAAANRVAVAGATLTDALDTALDKLLAQALEKAGKGSFGIVAQAVNLGMTEFTELATEAFTKVYYSAILDDGTCGTCEAADGLPPVRLGSPEEADLPITPNPDCESAHGGCNMCRCIWIYE